MSSPQPWDDSPTPIEPSELDPSVAVFTSPSRSRKRPSPHSFSIPPPLSPVSHNEHEPLLRRREAKKPFHRPRPLWLAPFVIVAALSRGMTLAPRVEVFTQLSCSRLHHHYNHTESSSILPPRAGLFYALDPLGAQFNPGEHWVVIDPPLPPTQDEPWSDDETEDDPRRLPSARCMQDAGVQATAARLQTMFTTTMGLLSMLTTGFWGRYGERHGRTRVLTYSTLGLLLTDLIFILASTPNSAFSTHGHKLLLLSPIIEGSLGGWSTLQSAISAYVSDCTSSGSRARIFSSFMGAIFIGVGLGPLLGGWLVRNPIPFLTSPPHPGQPQVATVSTVFWVAVVLQLLNLFLVLLIMPESIHRDNGKGKARDTEEVVAPDSDVKTSNGGILGGFLSSLSVFLPVPVVIDGTVRKRKDWSLTFLACAMFGYMLSTGLYQIKYLYSGHVYGWGAEQLSYYISLLGTSRAVFLLFLLPFVITALKPKRKASKDKTKPKLTKAHIAREIKFDLGLSRLSLCIEIVALLAVVTGPAPLYKMHAQYMNALGFESSDGGDNTQFQNSQSLFVFASWLQCLGAGFVPAMQSLALCLLQARGLLTGGEGTATSSGSLFGALAVLQAGGQMVLGPMLFGLIYSGTVATYPKAVFVAAVGILVATLMALFLVRSPLAGTRSRLRGVSERRQRRISWEEEHRGRSRVSKDLRPESGYGTIQPVASGSGSA
ncbi:hypothetical protein MKEN_00360200 [Mycena kentingensis (nom. inval.)]|nr:hypothetical protein MKEN_00360200 [Mycena kentingensis (nom. inval.)]